MRIRVPPHSFDQSSREKERPINHARGETFQKCLRALARVGRKPRNSRNRDFSRETGVRLINQRRRRGVGTSYLARLRERDCSYKEIIARIQPATTRVRATKADGHFHTGEVDFNYTLSEERSERAFPFREDAFVRDSARMRALSRSVADDDRG